MPVPDLKDPKTIELGAMKRIVNPLPNWSGREIRNFKKFVKRFIHKNFTPLDANIDVSRERWLQHANYPAHRKQELSEVVNDFDEVPREHIDCKSFIKYESYAEYKHARTINPRDDHFKVFSGPIFKLIEEVVFKMKYFIKKIPHNERADYIMAEVYTPGGKYFVTDYTSFESSFIPEIMRACELQLYEYMSQNVEGGKRWYEEVSKALTGEQRLRFGSITVLTQGTRMSGDMCTSLGNGFTNLMLMLYAAERFDLGELRAVFEGDDGLGCFSSGRLPDPLFFESLAFRVKMDVVTDLFEASFCGMVFEPVSRQSMSDPFEYLADLGWTSSRYIGARPSILNGLLKAKAMSGLYEWKGAPVIPFLCKRLIYLTRMYDERIVLRQRTTSNYMYEQYKMMFSSELPFEEPTMATRLLFEKRYGIGVDTQLRLEKQFSEVELGECDVDIPFPQLWRDHYDAYVATVGRRGDGVFSARWNQ